MNEILSTAEAEAKAAVAATKAKVALAVTDITAIVANRVGDALIAAIVVVSMLIGHRL